MIYVNKVFLNGRVVNKPELRHTKDGVPVTNFTIKTIDSWKKTSDPSNIKYHKIICWGDLAERAVKVLDKGNITWIEGELSYHKSTKTFSTTNGGAEVDVELTNVEVKCLNLQTHAERKEDDDSATTIISANE